MSTVSFPVFLSKLEQSEKKLVFLVCSLDSGRNFMKCPAIDAPKAQTATQFRPD